MGGANSVGTVVVIKCDPHFPLRDASDRAEQMQLHRRIEMPSGGQPREAYDPLDRTFYYLRLRSNHPGSFFDRSLIRRSYLSMRFWIEA